MLPPFLFFLALTGLFAGTRADLIIRGGPIYTVDPANRVVEAVAVKSGRVLAAGSLTEIDRYRGKHTRVLELAGGCAYPGFVDSHAHLAGLGDSLEILDLKGLDSPEQVLARVGQAAAETPPGGWIRGRGWDQNRWPGREYPDRAGLDRVAGDHPVLLTRVDGHAAWVNTKALELAGLAGPLPRIEGGEILTGPSGRPTGILVDNAIDRVRRVMPEAGPEDIARRLKKAFACCLEAGLTEVHEAGVGPLALEVYRGLQRRGALPVRVWAMLEGEEQWLEKTLRRGVCLDKTGFLTVRAVKMYADGALGSRGAWLLEPYQDRSDTCGLSLTDRGTLERVARLSARHGFQMCTHAIGDRANREVLDVYERVLADFPDGRSRRFRIEHAQVLNAADLPRFARLGVLPSMQPTHCTSDMSWAVDRLGPARVRLAYAWRSLIEAGSLVPSGSDFPIEGVNPLLGFYAAITRQDLDGHPPGGWQPEQTLTREQALRSMTVWAAYAGFQERDKGSLEPGKWADLTVLDRDIMTVSAAEIPNARVLWTLVAGRVAYSNPTSEDRN